MVVAIYRFSPRLMKCVGQHLISSHVGVRRLHPYSSPSLLTIRTLQSVRNHSSLCVSTQFASRYPTNYALANLFLIDMIYTCSLNSRKMFLTRGMEILDGKVLGRNIIARANQLAAAERWDVPQVRLGTLLLLA